MLGTSSRGFQENSGYIEWLAGRAKRTCLAFKLERRLRVDWCKVKIAMTRNNGESDPYFRRVKYSQSNEEVLPLTRKIRRERKRSIEKSMTKVSSIFLEIFPSYNYYPRLIMVLEIKA